MPFKTIRGLSLFTIPTISHDTEPIINAQYPNNTICDATKKAPIIEVTVPSQEVSFIIGLLYNGIAGFFAFCKIFIVSFFLHVIEFVYTVNLCTQIAQKRYKR